MQSKSYQMALSTFCRQSPDYRDLVWITADSGVHTSEDCERAPYNESRLVHKLPVPELQIQQLKDLEVVVFAT